MDGYWRAANYLSVGQIYLRDNPLLREPLTIEHVKPMLLGHWGTTPGQNFIYVHLNRIIRQYDLNMIYLSGPGHGGPAVVGNTYLEGTYSEVYPEVSQDEAGLKRLFTQFSFPGGIPSHASPECPGSIHEGGELGYSLSHAFGAVFDNPDLIAACVVGDGEAETGPLATAWHSNKFLNPITDGVVLPILHLNGYKIANPTIFARISHEEQEQFFRGCGWSPLFVRGSDPMQMHAAMAAALDEAVAQIRAIRQPRARRSGSHAAALADDRPGVPEGLDGPEIRRRRSQRRDLPLPPGAACRCRPTSPQHLAQLEAWLRSYRPEELFDPQGRLVPEFADVGARGRAAHGRQPARQRRLPAARAAACRTSATMPWTCPHPGRPGPGDTRVLAQFLRKVTALNMPARNFRIFGPDETISNGLEAVFDATARQWNAEPRPNDEYLAQDGRVMEMLSEHQCQGWLEGYLLTGRHGLFNCYEAFVHIVDSMFNQHAKWLKVTAGIPWRRKIASLNYLLASHVWRQDHNGFTHQDPGFIDHVVNKKAGVVRVYLPPDANCLLSVMDHCLRSKHYVNVVVAGKHPAPQWLTHGCGHRPLQQGYRHLETGPATISSANRTSSWPAPGMCRRWKRWPRCRILRQHLPTLRIRVINVVDLMKLQPQSEHPHGLDDLQFDELFTRTSR